MTNFSTLRDTAASIRDEKARAANTAPRVGTLLYNMCLAMADTDATASADHPVTQALSQWLTTHDNLTTLDALNAALDAMTVDTPQGLHCFKCFGIPVLTYFGVLVKDTKRYVQIAVGAFTLNTQGTALASINDTASTRNVIVRYFNGTKWQPWQPLQPQKQTSYSGYSGSYVYSEGTTDNTRTILSSKMCIRQNGAYDQFLCIKHWGATNDTTEAQCSQVMLPKAWIGGTGLLRWDVYRRLDNFELFEQNSTATEVKVVTPIFTTGGTRVFGISAATSAKAGVMTAAQATQLSALNEGLKQVTENGKKVFRTLQGEKVIETHCDYVGEKVSLDDFNAAVTDIPYKEGDQIELYVTKGAYGVSSDKYMTWFGRRMRGTDSSNYGTLVRYDFKTIAGMEPEVAYSKNVNGYILHFWTRTKGYVRLYRGSAGLTPEHRTVPYVMNTDDKAMIDRLKASLSS